MVIRAGARCGGAVLAGAIVLLSGSVPAAAQWFTYPNPAVPRTADGKPDLAAPAPRTADGKPDFSGVWLAGNHLPCPPLLRDELGNCIEKIPLSRETRDIGAKDDPHARCMPSSVPSVWSLPHYNKVVQIPGLLLVLNEFNASYRQVFTDARPLPEDPNPSWTGYSSARWEGDTLVVDTIGFRDDLWLDMAGNPLTSAANMRERIRRPSFGRLEIEITIDDRKAYTRPWTVTIPMDHAVDVELLEEMCLENEKFGPKMDGK
jgi:hypothetical protein